MSRPVPAPAGTAAQFREYFQTRYGPVRAVTAAQTDPTRRGELDAATDELAVRYGAGGRPSVMEWEYVLVTATRV